MEDTCKGKESSRREKGFLLWEGGRAAAGGGAFLAAGAFWDVWEEEDTAALKGRVLGEFWRMKGKSPLPFSRRFFYKLYRE